MEAGYIKAYNQSSSFRCLAFDQAMLVVQTVKSMVNLGVDYENPYTLNKYIRQAKFTGCSGYVSFTSASNDRSTAPTSIYNFHQINESTWLDEVCGYFDPSNSNLFNIHQSIVWYDGTINIPNDFRFTSNCGFDETKATVSDKANSLLYVYCAVIFLFCGLFSVYLVKYVHVARFPEHKNSKAITGQDILVYMVMMIDVFQYFLIGITPNDSSNFIYYFSEISGANLNNLLNQNY